ncbi:MAG: Nitrogen fixation protein VnfA [Planctomycetota bacterium]|jgi:Nif-specific regulatory protein
MNAYLVIRQGGRWTDVFHLSPGQKISVGRASTNSIVIPEERCSRTHAEIFLQDGAWYLRDLQSRNGTIVNGESISDNHLLQNGDQIQIASGQLEFLTSLSNVFQKSPLSAPSSSVQQTASMGSGSESIIARRDHSGILDDVQRNAPSSTAATPALDAATSLRLYQLAFHLSTASSPEEAATIALRALLQETGAEAGGVFLYQVSGDLESDSQEFLFADSSKDNSAAVTVGNNAAVGSAPIQSSTPPMILLATEQSGGKGYRSPSDFLAATVFAEKQGILARNIGGVTEFLPNGATASLAASSLIVAPIRFERRILGMIHIYHSNPIHPLTASHLQIAIAVADTLALAFEKITSQRVLQDSLQSALRKTEQLQEQLSQQSLMVGDSSVLKKIKDVIARAAPTNATILIRGESGAGKELVAQLLHQMSPRKDGPFICVNCAALSPTLLESELFGHEKGAFTGAIERKIGRFEAAHGGTLLLDEVGEMTPEIQTKFLRVLETRTIERLGSHKPIPVDVRVISATNRDLEEAVQDGLFRSDLYFRLKVIQIEVPALRQRGDDIPLLALHFLKRFVRETGRKLDGFTADAIQALTSYRWPGNVRELKNVVERAVVLSTGNRIEVEDLALDSIGRIVKPSEGPAGSAEYQPLSLDQIEREHILATLRYTQGNKSRTSSILGIERSTLDRKLQRFSLTPEDWKSN